jgi:Cellulase (glycosyl hydrolase family 5)
MRSNWSRRLPALMIAGAIGCLGSAAPAVASSRQVSVFEDDTTLTENPAGMLQEARHLGVNTVRLAIRWSTIAPSPTSRTRPNFNASDPNAYPVGVWSIYDTIVADAKADGIQLMFNPTGYAPLWAQGANPAKYGSHYDPKYAFMPSASEYKQFVEAVSKRYPTVHTWELYNEPNFGEDLSPQGIDGSHVLYAPVMYRALAGAGWSALHATGHGRDTILIGATAAHGSVIPSNHGTGLPGAYGETPPLQFMRELYCLDSNYRPYRGAAAAVRNCPTTAAAARSFRAQNPVLFRSSGWSTHPYPLGKDGGLPPTQTNYKGPNYAGFSQLPNVSATLDRIQSVYHSGTRLPVWNTEYGYITNPPNRSEHFVSPTTQGLYDNWAEYLSWSNSRIASAMQFLLYDPNPVVGTPECGGFASGLLYYPVPMPTPGCTPFAAGAAKPGLDAYRLPIFLPQSSAHRGQAVTVWGCLRPAHYALVDTGKPQTVSIKYQRAGGGAWSTVASATFTNPSASCYFTRRVKFPASGSVRLSYSYPVGDVRLQPGVVQTYFDPAVPTVSRTASIAIK